MSFVSWLKSGITHPGKALPSIMRVARVLLFISGAVAFTGGFVWLVYDVMWKILLMMSGFILATYMWYLEFGRGEEA